jgi:hypothetical protein
MLTASMMLLGCGSSGSSGGAGLGSGGCLSDQQICQFQMGVSTENDVKSALGNAQEYLGSSTWVYVCQVVSGTQILHNDETIFDFDSMGRLMDVMVLRQGSASTPPPTCAGGMVVGSSGGSGGSSSGSGSGCASVPTPDVNTTTCSSVVNPATMQAVERDCRDQSGNTWGQSCGSNGTCTCYYGGAPACSCTPSTTGGLCCPGVLY